MRKIKISILVLIIGVSGFFGCNRGDRLNRAIQKELSTTVRNDSLFLGLEFGITQQEFYDHCWDLNRRGVVREGMNNMSVEYLFKDSLDQPISFNFYSVYNEEKIHSYKTTFYYYAWAPSHKHFQSDKMLEMLTPILLDWYGGNKPFKYVVDGKLHHFKIDGNRMIDMYIVDDMYVAAMFRDLSNPENQILFNDKK